MFKAWIKERVNSLSLFESTLDDLFDSAVKAFPRTTRRQHVTDSIEIDEIRYTPFIGVKTLLVRSVATNEDREYKPVILFKNVVYHNQNGNGLVEIIASDNNQKYYLEKLDVDVLVRCQCGDYFWRANYANSLDHSLYGLRRKKYEALYNPGSANPTNAPMLCKHLMKLWHTLQDTNLVT